MELVRQMLTLGLVFGLLTLAVWSLRRKGLVRLGGTTRGKKGLRRLEAVERLPLSPQHALHLVRVADRVLLIGVHPSGCTLLESLPQQGCEEGAACTSLAPAAERRSCGPRQAFFRRLLERSLG